MINIVFVFIVYKICKLHLKYNVKYIEICKNEYFGLCQESKFGEHKTKKWALLSFILCMYMCLIQRITKCINCKCHLLKCTLSFHFKFQHSFQHKKIIMHIEWEKYGYFKGFQGNCTKSTVSFWKRSTTKKRTFLSQLVTFNNFLRMIGIHRG